MASKRTAFADKQRCAACGACAKECPKGAIQIWKGCYALIDSGKCVGCGRCAKICPADCIVVSERGAQNEK